MRIQGIVLENHGDVAILRLHVGDVGITDQDTALIDFLQAGQHTKSRRLTATRGTNQDEELAILDFKVQIPDKFGSHVQILLLP